MNLLIRFMSILKTIIIDVELKLKDYDTRTKRFTIKRP